MYKELYLWWNWKPAAGFRFSPVDALAIVLCTLATWGAWPFLGELAILFPIVLGHFFLFCNVFRIPRLSELLWSATFIINVGAWAIFNEFTWLNVLLTQLPMTLLAVLSGVCRSDYHGIGFLLVPWAQRPKKTVEVAPHDARFQNECTSDD